MKKVIALLLVLIMCMPLISCEKQGREALIGEWTSLAYENRSLVVRADGTGTLTYNEGDETELRWKYDEELNGYLLVVPNQAAGVLFVTIEKQDGCRYVNISGNMLYSTERLEKAREVESKRKIAHVDTYYTDYTKVQLNQTLTYQSGITMQIADFDLVENYITMRVRFTNITQNDVWLSSLNCRVEGVYNKTKYTDFDTAYITPYSDYIPAGQTVEATVTVGTHNSSFAEDDTFNYVLCGLQTGDQRYVIDITELLK